MRIYNWKVALIGLILLVFIVLGAISFADVSGEEVNTKTAEQCVVAE